MNQNVASKLANSVRQAKENLTSAKTKVDNKPASAQGVKNNDVILPSLKPSRRVWPD